MLSIFLHVTFFCFTIIRLQYINRILIILFVVLLKKPKFHKKKSHLWLRSIIVWKELFRNWLRFDRRNVSWSSEDMIMDAFNVIHPLAISNFVKQSAEDTVSDQVSLQSTENIHTYSNHFVLEIKIYNCCYAILGTISNNRIVQQPLKDIKGCSCCHYTQVCTKFVTTKNTSFCFNNKQGIMDL